MREELDPPFHAYVGEAPFIFVSYSHQDKKIVYPEIERLHGLGYRIWYDEGIDPGNEWPDEIALALKRCAMFMVFVSPTAVLSRNVKNEINFAMNHNKRFLAVHVAETTLPEGLELRMGDIQAAMRYRMTEESYFRQIEKILVPSLIEAGAATKEAAEPAKPEPVRVVPPRVLVAGMEYDKILRQSTLPEHAVERFAKALFQHYLCAGSLSRRWEDLAQNQKAGLMEQAMGTLGLIMTEKNYALVAPPAPNSFDYYNSNPDFSPETPVIEPLGERCEEFKSNYIEDLAQWEYCRWHAQRIQSGFGLMPASLPSAYVPWTGADKQVKEFVRGFVREWPRLLVREAGFKLIYDSATPCYDSAFGGGSSQANEQTPLTRRVPAQAEPGEANNEFGIMIAGLSYGALLNEARGRLKERVIDRFARALHKQLQQDGGLPKRMQQEWENLPAGGMQSLLEYAAGILGIILRSGYEIVKEEDMSIPSFGADECMEFLDEDIEPIAKREHNRWRVHSLRRGWSHGPNDPAQKRSAFLVPWDNLEEGVKHHYRSSIRKWPSLVTNGAGLHLRAVDPLFRSGNPSSDLNTPMFRSDPWDS